MNPTITGIQKLFEFLGTVGKWIRHIVGQQEHIELGGDVSGTADVMVTIRLDPELDRLIRDILSVNGSAEEPEAYWYRATQALIIHNEQKFQTLSRLGVSDVTLGTEAITQGTNEVPDEIAQVTVRYVERYVMMPEANEAYHWALPPSSLTNAFEIVMRNANKNNSSSFTDRIGVPRVRPEFGQGEHRN